MNIPKHLAVIIDGNRRWAVANGLSKLEGHRHGLETLKKLIPTIMARDISVVSIFAFSTENWRRAADEVSALMGLIKNAFAEYFAWLNEQGVRVYISGRVGDFSEDIRDVFKKAVEDTRGNTKLIANFCMSYGGREEITEAARRIAGEMGGDASAIAAINEKIVEQNLYTVGLPDVDLLIRTGGEKRLSGFLPWQSVYAELYFTDTLWPDFGGEELDRALADFANRKRNFGT